MSKKVNTLAETFMNVVQTKLKNKAHETVHTTHYLKIPNEFRSKKSLTSKTMF